MIRKPLPALLVALLGLGLAVATGPARGGDEPYIGEIAWVAFNFVPPGWHACDGSILPIASNTALFSLLGITYGGNGTTTFALPNLQGRVLVDDGLSSTGRPYAEGEVGGEETHTLTSAEIPAHYHTIQVSSAAGSSTSPAGAHLGASASGTQYGNAATRTAQTQALTPAGNSTPHNNMMPYLTLNCIIAIQGVFPPHP
jgi:microcystin-dependent protein